MPVAGRPSTVQRGDLHLHIDVEARLKGGGAKLGERGEVVGTLSNAEPLDVPLSLAQCSLSTSYLLNIYNNGYNEHIIVMSFIFHNESHPNGFT